MLLLMTVAAVVCVLQLAVLGSFARSVRMTTLLMAIGVGFYFCGTLAVLLQVGWTRAVAAGTDWSLGTIVEKASYTADPVIEEVIKLVPLVLLGWWWTAGRRQLGLTDHLLAGAALGVGFELFESALRYSTLRALSLHVSGGYLVSAGLGGSVTVPSLWHSLSSWQPAPAAFSALLASGADTVQHLVWTALAAFGLGWIARRRGPMRWLGLTGLIVACLDHANYNLNAASAVPASLKPFSEVLTWLGGRLQTVMVIALVVAVAADRQVLSRWRARFRDLLLTGEPVAMGGGTLTSRALVAVPWSTYTTWRFVLARRGTLFGVAADADDPDLRAAIAHDRARLERARSGPAWKAAGERLLTGLRRALAPKRLLRSPAMIVWFVSLIPALAYLVAGGFPATQRLQQWMLGETGLWLLVGSGLAGAVLLLFQLRYSWTVLRSVPPSSLHEARVRPQERILTAAGGLVAVVPVLLLAVVHRTADRALVQNLHALDALGSLYVLAGLALFAAALIFFPPFALAVAEGELVLVPTLTAELGLAAVGSTALAKTGIMLSQAADDAGSSGSGDSGSSGSGEANAAQQQRIEELARDPAHGGRITPESRAEAEVGDGLERSGQVQGLRRSENPAEEFIDNANNHWDVKGFHSENGRFSLDKAMQSIWREMNWSHENVMLDTRNLSPGDLAQLRQAVESATGRGELPLRVLWWP